ncbi:ABC transporter permease [Shinella sp. BYT-45]|uniref:ABC transporter permease n=1 Tax=Shinella sp. BYT-45 TaxID=3377377 RepID=UPI00397FE33D
MAITSSAFGTATLDADQLRHHNTVQRRTRLIGTIIAIAVLLVVWQVIAAYNRPWVPSIQDTWKSMVGALSREQFYIDMLLTWKRLLLAFVTATLIGTAVGIAIGLNRKAEAFFAPLIALALAVPDPVYIIFASLAVGTGELAGYIALVLAVIPFVVNTVRTSTQARDRSLDEMAKIYHIPPARHFREVMVPQLVPALLTAARFSFALSWKIVIFVEALTQPDGVGARIYHYFHILRMRDAIACAIIFCILMQLVEKVTFAPLERRLSRWRT